MKHLLTSVAAAAALMLASCSKNNDMAEPAGTPNQDASMSYQLRANKTSGSLGAKTTNHGIINWTSGYAYPKELKFEAKARDTKIEYKSTNRDRIDLFAAEPIDFGGFVLPNGYYEKIELKIKLDGVGGDPALLLNGDYSDGTTRMPIIVRIDDPIELKTELKDVTVTGEPFEAVTYLDLLDYTDGITENMLLNGRLTNGVLVISRDSNRDLYKIITDQVKDKRHRCEFKKKKK